MPSRGPGHHPRRSHRFGEHSARIVALAALVALAAAGCGRAPMAPRDEDSTLEANGEPSAAATSAAIANAPSTVPGPASIERVLPYPRGRWRLAPLEELNGVMLWFSHLLIRYDGVLDPSVSFSLPEWSSVAPMSGLSREDALNLAQRVAAEAASGTVPFSDLVAAYSEDITTVDSGGSLGGVTASTIDLWGQIVDALAVLGPGQTSQVIETPFGFHILQKHAPPIEQMVSGARIVIAHDSAPMFRFFQLRGDAAHRSRSEAEALARDIYEQARRNPAGFTELVRRYSEHLDVEVEGDIGEWSTREAGAPAREIEALARLDVGEIAPPIDTFLGFQILMRTAPRDRPSFAHEELVLFFDPRAPRESPDSEASVHEQALELAERVRREPQAFDVLRKELCCLQAQRWRQGRREESIQRAISGLRFGEISATFTRTASSMVLLRRLDPERVAAPPPPRFELPADIPPDVEEFLGSSLEAPLAEEVLRNLGRRVVDELQLEGERRARLLEIHALPSGIGMGDERIRAVATIAAATRELLAPPEQETYRKLAVRSIERAVLERRPLPPMP